MHRVTMMIVLTIATLAIFGAAQSTPQPSIFCTIANDCHDHATAVTVENGGCKCTCRNSWTNSECQDCPIEYDSEADCGDCNYAGGYIANTSYPNCISNRCERGVDCFDNGTRTIVGIRPNCQCRCRNKFFGDKCDLCPEGFDFFDFCGSCARGFAGYPDCSPLCTNAGNCSNNAQSVNGTFRTGCFCTCANRWNGSDCSQCPEGYNVSAACGACIRGWEGYPDCDKTCVLADCGPNAVGVAGTVKRGCNCTCRNRWRGPTCNVCPFGFDSTADCGQCIVGYSGYPNCSRTCTSLEDCNDHAATVSGTQLTGCQCTCRNQWKGGNCSQCLTGYNATNDCGSCTTTYDGYPVCKRKCTMAEDCSNHAQSVTGLEGDCRCVCRNGWRRDNCSLCSLPFGGSDCERCADGYEGYPNCIKSCSLQADCSGHATEVVGFANGTCRCSCRNQWRGLPCGNCPAAFNASLDCGACADGYLGIPSYPDCYKLCDVVSNCSNHALAVNGTYFTGCNCTCRRKWSGPTCSDCPDVYDPGQDCGQCRAQYEDFPNCYLKCTNIANCSNRATSVSGNVVAGCNCTCRNKWYGDKCDKCPLNYSPSPDCNSCAAGYQSYPGCYLICTNAANCSGNAAGVTGNTFTGCTCTCRNKWNGTQCETCPEFYNASNNCASCVAGYGGYPNCRRICTIQQDCSGQATGVSGLEGACMCTCRNKWGSVNCSTCASNYNASADCGTCAAGYDTYPACYLTCTVPANCSNNAVTVTGNTFTKCNCTCRNAWSGANCGTCLPKYNITQDCGACAEGFDNYPSCQRICTDALDCSNHSTAVSGLLPTCNCTCRNSWSGPSCSICTAQYNRSLDCGECAVGYDAFSTYPNCFATCTIPTDCSNHATEVSGNTRDGCNCTCRNQWSGASCATCIRNYSTAADCGQCAPGFINYPECPRACTNALDCNGHATGVAGSENNCTCTCLAKYNGSACQRCAEGFDNYPSCQRICTDSVDCSNHSTVVSGLFPTCNCTCRNSWRGGDCSFCPSQFNSSLDCGECADAFKSFSTYPNCFATCTIPTDCSNHATEVTGNVRDGCNCTCRNQWSGPKCATCIRNYSTAADCGQCAPGYVYYPRCEVGCTNASNCNNNAYFVDGAVGNCTCLCRNQWRGQSCGICDSIYDTTKDCGTCSALYEDYPSCHLKCTNIANCSNHATSVSGNVVAGCNCTCRNQWYGERCDQCPPLIDSSRDCGVCVPGYSGYPACSRICTDAFDCSNHSTAVTGLLPDCRCTCRNAWSTANCSVCDAVYNVSRDCGACVQGRDTYPACYLTCTVPANCSGNAVSVTGNTFTGCNCICRNAWRTGDCSVCDANFNRTQDCGTCAAGYDDYPRCDRICTNTIDCSGHAANVSGLFPRCNCTCRNEWRGADCSFCPSQFDRFQDCSGCADGYEGTYPACYLKCTNIANCSNNAAFVSGNTNTGCNCTCRNRWNGTSCEFCAGIFDRTQDCGTCAMGYGGYPVCYRICSTFLDCNGQASSVTGDWPNCTCNCRNSWNGSTCDECEPRFARNSDCGACAPFFENYPVCNPACTNRNNCSNHASSVFGNITIGCFCTCRNAWNGSRCESCPPNIDPDEDCGACRTGYGGYPQCTELCTPNDCLNRSVSVSGNVPNCSCICRHSWEGGNCSVCPPNHNETLDCDPCAEGYETYPECHRICTQPLDCSNHSTAVSGNLGIGCNCTCRNQWSGSNCSTCASRFNSSLDCGECAEGYVDYPFCHRVCTNEQDCSGRAVNVSGVEPNCSCTCKNMWNGTACESCPSIFNPIEDCNSCAKWHVGEFPNCTLMTDEIPTSTNSTSETISESGTETISDSPTRTGRTQSPSLSPSESRSSTTTQSPPATPTAPPSGSRTGSPTATLPATATSPRTSTVIPPEHTPTLPRTASRVSSETRTIDAPHRERTHTSTVELPTPEPTTAVPSPQPTEAPSQRPRTHTATVVGTPEPTAATDTPTPEPTVNATTDAPTTGAPEPTNVTTEAPTPVPTTTEAPPPTRDPTIPCTAERDCSGHAVAVTALNGGRDCQCLCRNEWSGANCSICDARFNETDDCGSCLAPVYSGYPTCFATAHVVGGWMLERSCGSSLSRVPRQALLDAAAADLLDVVLTGSRCRACVAMVSGNPADFITAQMVSFNVSTAAYSFDVRVRNESVAGALIIAGCIADQLNATHSLDASGGNDGAGSSSFANITMNRTRALANSFGIAGFCFVPLGMRTWVTLTPPCGVHGCAAANDIPPPPPTPSSESSSPFPWYFIVAGVGGVLLLVGVIALVRKIHFARLGTRSVGSRAFVDAGKYTVDFLQHAKDEELELYSLRREMEFDDI